MQLLSGSYLPHLEEGLGHEADHSTPSGAEVKNYWICICSHPVCFHGVHRDRFISINYRKLI